MNEASRERQKVWWGLVIASSGAFVLASLAYVAAGFGDREVPVNRVLNEHGGTVITVLAGIAIGSGLSAMYLDQRSRQSPGSKESDGAPD